jgi:hypothetical protein
LSTVPVDASSAQSAPFCPVDGAQHTSGRSRVDFVVALVEAEVEALTVHPPLAVGVQIVPTNTTPPALTAGTERETPEG